MMGKKEDQANVLCRLAAAEVKQAIDFVRTNRVRELKQLGFGEKDLYRWTETLDEEIYDTLQNYDPEAPR